MRIKGDFMLNKKGFTIAEVIVSFSLISIILASMIATTMFYRDKVKEEEVLSQLWDFKNTITKVIYDDIINKNLKKVDTCVGIPNCVKFSDAAGTFVYTLKIVEYNETTQAHKRGVYLSYNNVQYMLPDSDLGTGYDRICDFVGGINLDVYENKLYKVKLSYRHKDMNKHYDLLFTLQ